MNRNKKRSEDSILFDSVEQQSKSSQPTKQQQKQIKSAQSFCKQQMLNMNTQRDTERQSVAWIDDAELADFDVAGTEHSDEQLTALWDDFQHFEESKTATAPTTTSTTPTATVDTKAAEPPKNSKQDSTTMFSSSSNIATLEELQAEAKGSSATNLFEGTMTLPELKTILRVFGEHYPEESIEKCFAAQDVNGDGQVTYTQFLRTFRDLRVLNTSELSAEAKRKRDNALVLVAKRFFPKRAQIGIIGINQPKRAELRYPKHSGKRRNVRLVLALSIMCAIVFLGGLAMQYFELPLEMEQKALGKLNRNHFMELAQNLTVGQELSSGEIDILKNYFIIVEERCEFFSSLDYVNWNLSGSTFFFMTMVSTIGYGNYAPQTMEGRAFVASTVIFGVAFFGYLLTILSERLLRLISFVSQIIMRKRAGFKLPSRRALPIVILLNLIFVFVLALPTLFYEQWSFSDSMYYSIVTVTTVGFGDKVPNFQVYNSPTSQLLMVLYAGLVLVGMALLSAVIAALQQLVSEYQQKLSSVMVRKRPSIAVRLNVQNKARALGKIRMGLKSSRVDVVTSRESKDMPLAAVQAFKSSDSKGRLRPAEQVTPPGVIE